MRYFCILFFIGLHFVTLFVAFSKANWENDLVLDTFNLKPNSSMIVAILPLRLTLCKLTAIAKGATKEHLMKALGLGKIEKVNKYYSSIRKMVDIFKMSDLIMLNKLYVNYTHEVDTKFLANSSLLYGVDTDSIGFNMPRTAHSFINNQIASATYRRITNIVELEDITPQTNMMMLTAANLKSTWNKPFAIEKTRNRKFFHLSNKVSVIPMMVLQDFYEVFEDESFMMLTMMLRSYGGIFTLVVPHLSQGLPGFLAKLKGDPDMINRARKKMSTDLRRLVFPRFKIKSYLDLTKTLRNSTVKDILNSSSSDLNDILKEEYRDKKNMFISKVKQNIFLQVDEFGSMRQAYPYPQITGPDVEWEKGAEFAADRPFYFTIDLVDDHQHHPLFHGVYYGPE